jgi:hypothetical protein
MTEEEWHHKIETYFPRGMLTVFRGPTLPRKLRPPKAVLERKLRLFGCAAIRRIWRLLVTPQLRDLVDAAESFADERVTRNYLRIAMRRAIESPRPEESRRDGDDLSGAWGYAREATILLGGSSFASEVVTFVEILFGATVNDPDDPEEENVYQKALLLDIFANPFRPATFDPRWRSESVVALAAAIYADRAFDRMPILADALEDAGCDNRDILDHCRGPGPHVRGCWVVDLVLGKQ